MPTRLWLLGLVAALSAGSARAEDFEKDVLKTSAGDVAITLIGHGTLMLGSGGKVIHVDPFSRLTDYAQLPKADLILLTHAHGDHLDAAALKAIRTSDTQVLVAPACDGKVEGALVLKNGERKVAASVTIEAVPAYNLTHKRPDGSPYHPKGEGNGYVLTFGNTRVYIAGDTENTPEMKALKGIDVAFLPMNLPYTMTPEMVADAARAIRPKVLYPYHFGDTDPQRLVTLLADMKDIDVRIRRMK
jgi:L-ascorbate metabolism protein UlaG (beta-lactamase superfamily)